MTNPGVVHAINKGTAFLRTVQLKDGGFKSFSSPMAYPFTAKKTYITTFAPALILNALRLAKGEDAATVRRQLAGWLLAQKSKHWSFNYWAADAPQRESLPYPDDLDDTFCALIGLHSYDPSLIDADCLGHVVKLLIATESQVGGPYRTWLAAKNAPKVWQDIDLAVNSNINYFLAQVAEPLPNVTALMDQAIASNTLDSPYYPSIYPLAYYLSRAYHGPRAAALAKHLQTLQEDNWWQTPLQTALSISALVNTSRAAACGAAVQRLLAAQLTDGSWPAEGFCLDPAIKQQTYFSGSPALTTALAVEALLLYNQNQAPEPRQITSKTDNKIEGMLHARIASTARQEIKQLAEPLRSQSLTTLSTMERWDENHEIILLPHLFNNSLKRPLGNAHTPMLAELSLANLYGWTAYTIYDNFLDNEGNPHELSVANLALRYSLEHFTRAQPANHAFQTFVRATFDSIDNANAWELAHCRAAVDNGTITIKALPRFAKTASLADRSAGHALAPLGILAATGIAPDKPKALLVRRALQHYLAARQLNDDMHDWEQDMRSGIFTYVVTTILRELSVKKGEHLLETLIPQMKNQFWHHTVLGICNAITKQTALARSAAKASGLFAPANLIVDLADAIDASVAKTIAEQGKAEQFLAAYREAP